jgi:hypothetical protein
MKHQHVWKVSNSSEHLSNNIKRNKCEKRQTYAYTLISLLLPSLTITSYYHLLRPSLTITSYCISFLLPSLTITSYCISFLLPSLTITSYCISFLLPSLTITSYCISFLLPSLTITSYCISFLLPSLTTISYYHSLFTYLNLCRCVFAFLTTQIPLIDGKEPVQQIPQFQPISTSTCSKRGEAIGRLSIVVR